MLHRNRQACDKPLPVVRHPAAIPCNSFERDMTGRLQTVLTQDALGTQRCEAAMITPLPVFAHRQHAVLSTAEGSPQRGSDALRWH